MLEQDRSEKPSAESIIRSGEIPSPRQTSIDKINGCAMKSERGALVTGSDPPFHHRAYTTAGNMWQGPARRLTPKHSAADV